MTALENYFQVPDSTEYKKPKYKAASEVLALYFLYHEAGLSVLDHTALDTLHPRGLEHETETYGCALGNILSHYLNH